MMIEKTSHATDMRILSLKKMLRCQCSSTMLIMIHLGNFSLSILSICIMIDDHLHICNTTTIG